MDVEPGRGNCGGDTLGRLKKWTSLPECFRDRAAAIPVVVEWPGHHRRGGVVTFLNGHTEYMTYPGKFPMTKEFIEGLRSLDALGAR